MLPLRVLHVIAGLETGGAETMLAGLVAARLPGIQHAVASMIPGGAVAARIEAGGTELLELGMRRGRPSARGLLLLAGLLRGRRPDVLQSWMYHADIAATLALRLSGRRRDVRHAWNLRCSDMAGASHGAKLRVIRRAWCLLSPAADLVIANSEAGLAYHRALGLDARATEVIPNGIDAARFRPDPQARARARAELGIAADARVVAHVARVDAMKDHRTLFAALALLPGTPALLIGRGTRDLHPPAEVRALGERADVPALLAAADLIVSSSAYGEGFSNALAEGMAAGLPAVATDIGDARLILGDTGIVCAPGDPRVLAEAIGRLLAEPEAAFRARGEAARRRIVEHFALQRCALRYAEAWRRLLPLATRVPARL